jgi:hypothetical protein
MVYCAEYYARGVLGIAADDRSGFYFHRFAGLTPTPCAPATTPVTAPKVSIHPLRRSLRKVLARRRLPVRVTTNSPMRVSLYARLRVGRRWVTVALARVRFTRARTRVVHLRLTKTGQRTLAHRRRAKLRIIVRARAADGRLIARATRITLRR